MMCLLGRNGPTLKRRLTTTMQTEHDYLAFILIGAGSSYGRATDKETAIKEALRSLRDWKHLYKVSDVDVVLNVVDVQGYDRVTFAYDGVFGVPEATPGAKGQRIDREIERVERRRPKFKR